MVTDTTHAAQTLQESKRCSTRLRGCLRGKLSSQRSQTTAVIQGVPERRIETHREQQMLDQIQGVAIGADNCIVNRF